MIDTNRQWFKSAVGVDATETSRDIAFCAHTVLRSDIFIVPDAARDDRFADNSLVTSAPHIRFYAGMPLIASKGEALGTLCVIDRVPRQLTPTQQDALRRLGRQTVQLLELRRTNLEHKKTEAALRDGEARFRQVVESAPNGILMVRSDGTIMLVNAQVERLFGYSREELLGQSIDRLLPNQFRAQHPANVQRFFANPSGRAMGTSRDLFGLRKDGHDIPIGIGSRRWTHRTARKCWLRSSTSRSANKRRAATDAPNVARCSK
ncbi:MAG: PAS domain S-box protein [Planctomycetota bacterium]